MGARHKSRSSRHRQVGLRSTRQGLRRMSVSTTACGYPDLLVHLFSISRLTFTHLRTLPNIFLFLFLFISRIEKPYIRLRSWIVAQPIPASHSLLLTVMIFPVVLRTNQYPYEQWTTARSRRASLHTALSRRSMFTNILKTFPLVLFQSHTLLS